MKSKITLILFAFMMLFISSCFSHSDGRYPSEEVTLRLEAKNPEKYNITVKGSEHRQMVPDTGVVTFQTPEWRCHQPIIMGIPLSVRYWNANECLILRYNDEIVQILSCNEIWDLPKDNNGITILKISE